jgi:hypothetical protein
LRCARPANAEAAISLARELDRVVNFGVAMAGAISLALGDDLSMEQITLEVGARCRFWETAYWQHARPGEPRA